MPQILVRDLEPEVVDALKARAKRFRRSLEAEVRLLLSEAADRERAAADFWERADRMRESLRGRPHTDSAILIREDRDA
jgi:plasmid stability protein